MANALIGFPVYSDASVSYSPTWAGGSYAATLPVTNLADRRQHYVARTTDDAVTSTLATCDLGVARAVRCAALVAHNLSEAALVRWRGMSAQPILASVLVGSGLSWTAEGTPTRTAAAFTSADGIPMDLIEDNDAAAVEGYYITPVFTGDATKTFSIRAKAGTATASDIGIRDNTAATWRHQVRLTWSGGVPSLSTINGAGTAVATLIETGVYRITVTATGVVAANSNRVYVYATNTSTTSTGTCYFGDLMVWDAATDPLVYDSGFVAALPSGTDAEERDGWNPTTIHIADSDQTARYWRLNIEDTANTDGYVQIGRAVLTGGIQPTVNASVGLTLGWTDPDTTKQRTDGAATVYNARRRRREVRMVFEHLSDADAFGPMAQLLQRAGTSGQMLFALDPDDAATIAWQRSFLGVLTELSPIQFPYPTYRGIPIAITEEL